MNKDAFLAGYLSKEAGYGADFKRGMLALWSPWQTAKDIGKGITDEATRLTGTDIDGQRAAYRKANPAAHGSFKPAQSSRVRVGANALLGDKAKSYQLQREQMAYNMRNHLIKTRGQAEGDRYFKILQNTPDFMHKSLKDYHKYGGNIRESMFKDTVTKRATPVIRKKVIGDAVSKYAPMALGALGVAGSAYLSNNAANRRHKELLKAVKGRSARGTAEQDDRIFRLSRTGRSM
jgi:hypothetical protein